MNPTHIIVEHDEHSHGWHNTRPIKTASAGATPEQGAAPLVGTGSWFGGDSREWPSAAWTELRNRLKAGEKIQEYQRGDGARGWLLYTMKEAHRIAVLWENERNEIIYPEHFSGLLPPNAEVSHDQNGESP